MLVSRRRRSSSVACQPPMPNVDMQRFMRAYCGSAAAFARSADLLADRSARKAMHNWKITSVTRSRSIIPSRTTLFLPEVHCVDRQGQTESPERQLRTAKTRSQQLEALWPMRLGLSGRPAVSTPGYTPPRQNLAQTMTSASVLTCTRCVRAYVCECSSCIRPCGHSPARMKRQL